MDDFTLVYRVRVCTANQEDHSVHTFWDMYIRLKFNLSTEYDCHNYNVYNAYWFSSQELLCGQLTHCVQCFLNEPCADRSCTVVGCDKACLNHTIDQLDANEVFSGTFFSAYTTMLARCIVCWSSSWETKQNLAWYLSCEYNILFMCMGTF